MPRWLPYAMVALFAVYFPLALWLKYTHVDPTPKGDKVVLLGRPFEQFDMAAVAHGWAPLGSLDEGADDQNNNERSQMLLYEDGVPLNGPAHSSFATISKIGNGRYSHWKGQGFVFSSSDNSDPNSNGRKYWAVLP